MLHGTAFEFFRHESLNARNFFQTANATKPWVPPQPVRGCSAAGAAQSDVLLRRLSGAAPGYRAHRVLDGADHGATSRRLHAEHLRPGDDDAEWLGGFTRRSSATTRSPSSGWIRWRASCCCGIRSRRRQHGQQLSAHGERDRRSESVGCPAGSRVRVEPRSRVCAALQLPRPLRTGHPTARRQQDDDRNARAAGHDVLGPRDQLSAHLRGQSAERTAWATPGAPCIARRRN